MMNLIKTKRWCQSDFKMMMNLLESEMEMNKNPSKRKSTHSKPLIALYSKR